MSSVSSAAKPRNRPQAPASAPAPAPTPAPAAANNSASQGRTPQSSSNQQSGVDDAMQVRRLLQQFFLSFF